MESDTGIDAIAFDPATHPDRTGWPAVDRRLHRWSLRDALRSAVVPPGGRLPPARWSIRRAVRTGAAALVTAVSVGALAAGVWIGAHGFPGVTLLPATVLIAFGILVLPRPAPLPADATRLTPAAVPSPQVGHPSRIPTMLP